MKLREGAGLALGVLACVACSGDVGSDDAAASVDIEAIIGGTVASGYPEAAYLNIDMAPSGGYACSGTLIAPRVVLTAGHCVDHHAVFEVYVSGAYRKTTSAAVYDWNENGAETVNPNHHDIGLVFLNDSVTLKTYPTLAKVKVADNTKVTDVGRVLNGTVQSNAYQAAAVVSVATGIGYPFDYKSADVIQPGDSGGPVFTSGTHNLIAVNSGAGNGTQVLARVDLLYDWIAAQVAAHAGTSGTDPGVSGSAGAGGASNAGAGGKGGAASVGDAGKAAAGGGSGGKGSGDAVKAGAGGSGDAVKAGAAGAAGAANTCTGTAEKEANNEFKTANAISGAACGALATTTDADWFKVSAGVGTHALQITTVSDATVALGIVSGTSCVLSAQNVKKANVTVGGGTANLCIRVSSPGKKIQNYGLSFQ